MINLSQDSEHKPMKTKKSTTLLPHLPEELITLIMLRLPVKTLMKFRCVSRSWLFLISNPKFIKSHLETSTNNNIYHHNNLIFGPRSLSSSFTTWCLNPNVNSSTDTVPFDCDLNEQEHGDMVRIVGSCNGLVCVALEPCYVILWNPSTRKSRKLPVSSSRIFDMQYGFGYDVCNDDYKVVESSWSKDEPDVLKFQVKVYSSRSGSWRVVHWTDGRIFGDSGVFVNGALHWKVYYNDDTRDWAVIAQNVTSESCESVKLPAGRYDSARIRLGTSGNRLFAFYDYWTYMNVWVLREYGVAESWTKLVCVPYFGVRLDRSLTPKPLFVWENGGILLNLGSDIVVHKPWPSRYHEIFRLNEYTDVEATTFESRISLDLDYGASSLFVSGNGENLLNLGSWPSRCHEIFRLSEYTDVEATTFSESLVSPDPDYEVTS